MKDSLTEEDIYLSSTQYQSWTFTKENLSTIRHAVNKQATRRAQKTAARAVKKLAASSGKDISNMNILTAIEPLTVDQEQQLVAFYCNFCFTLGRSVKLATITMATAVQFLKRFYIHNSPMQYHPKQIALSALFFASKVDNSRRELADFVSDLQKAKVKKVTPESILEYEFVLCQGLKFNFTVIHPHRGLKGHLINLLSLTDSKNAASQTGTLSPSMRALRDRLLNRPLPRRDDAAPSIHTSKEVQERIMAMYMHAKHVVDKITPITDAYFHYTPSQICFAAMLKADEAIALAYLQAVTATPPPALSTFSSLPVTSSVPEDPETDPFSPPFSDLYNQLYPVIVRCSEVIQTVPIQSKREELVKFDMRLFLCLNPDTAAERFLFPDALINTNGNGSGNGNSSGPETKGDAISPLPPLVSTKAGDDSRADVSTSVANGQPGNARSGSETPPGPPRR